MTTINTSEDLLRLLREDAHFYEQARRLILTDELITLPQRFTELVQIVTELSTKLDAFAEATDRRLAALEADVSTLKADVSTLKADVAEIKVGQQRIQDDVGALKGDAALRATKFVTWDIANDMGMSIIRDLPRAEIRDMRQQLYLSDMRSHHLQSFARADAIIEAEFSPGQSAYIAVEASYTADERDTFRAIRNAHYLRRMTGRPTYAAISALRLDDRIKHLVDCGAVHWHQLSDEDFSPD